jgi:xanthine dehydrogenase accessory factor
MYRYRHDIWIFARNGGPFVLVNIDGTQGSTPRDEGAWMLVSQNKTFRTIGGGQLEKMAIDRARDLIIEDHDRPIKMKVPLGPEIGQCCGGTVVVSLRRLGENEIDMIAARLDAELASLPTVHVFGAGHVGRALCEALGLLPVHPVLIDTRKEELDCAPAGVRSRLVAMPEEVVREARPDSAFIILTHEHALDFLIAKEALLRPDAAYVGMIGSKTKYASFRRWLTRETGTDDGVGRLVCPIGGSQVRDKRPEVIAALAAAEIAQHMFAGVTKVEGMTSTRLRIVGGGK